MNWTTAIVAIGVGLTEQVLLTVGGQIAPDESRLYGAPLPVGRELDLIGLNSGSFEPTLWIINVAVTCAIIWLLAVWLGAQFWRGTIVMTLVTLAGLAVVGAGHQFQLLSWEVRLLPLWSWAQVLVWLLGLVALALAWGGLGPRERGAHSR